MQTQPSATRSSFRGKVHVYWPLLTVDDLERIEADPESLVDCVQDVYQLSGDAADLEVHNFEVATKAPDFEASIRPRVNAWIAG
jgi:hypothetical protein